jgi:hypothetical protein
MWEIVGLGHFQTLCNHTGRRLQLIGPTRWVCSIRTVHTEDHFRKGSGMKYTFFHTTFELSSSKHWLFRIFQEKKTLCD